MNINKPDKKRMQETQQIFHHLIEVVELYPRFSVCQHLAAILRRKSIEGDGFYFWNNEEMLKRVEKYKDELEGEQLMNEVDEIS